jgi:hypothetical protein
MRLLGSCLCLVFFLYMNPLTYQGQGNSQDERALAVASSLKDSIQQCPRREVVVKPSRRWVKQSWGPPSQVKFDVEKTASLVHPYRITIEFALVWSYGPNRKTQQEAARDTELRPLLVSTNRNIYELGNDQPSLYRREVRHGAEPWMQRPRWSDACWDIVGEDSSN